MHSAFVLLVPWIIVKEPVPKVISLKNFRLISEEAP